MKILVLNSGSSSIKYKFFELEGESYKVLAEGMVDRLGIAGSILKYTRINGDEEHSKKIETDIPNHEAGLKMIAEVLMDNEFGVIKSAEEVDAIGHRVVHGGEKFSGQMVIDESVKKQIKNLFELAPLHNPPNYTGIEVCEKVFPGVKQVGVFDTAFHQSIPEVAFRYAIPEEWYKKYHVRAYGFHGTSHRYVSEKARKILGTKNSSRMITLHLGNGASMAAIKDGKCVDTSMGFSPLAGLIMGTRSGDLDPTIPLYMVSNYGIAADEVDRILNKESGLAGIAGESDMRDLEDRMKNGDKMATLAIEMYVYRIKRYIGSFASVMNGLDAMVFTAGVGENSDYIRDLICKDLEYFGVNIDGDLNQIRNDEARLISSEKSKVKLMVVPTNEELAIAQRTVEVLS
ncbi:acetate/propionate family kinase [Marinigracilibium pacificum]|uniref:Acetate kinase n=1 Tax=Marinigracilibium pacificum TaxID=2729599 RepID=A0A848JAF1_9BACT|nr:acetate kinase [Marinigracilibium pacificum]NMM50022.1 acetate kinase [Marinigracilibium pacificum]